MYSSKDSPQSVYVTPSYTLVVAPESNPIVMANHGHESKLVAQVLNNKWVCVPSTPFRQHCVQISKYQEALNQCKEHFEIEMLFNSIKLNFENIGELCIGINDKGINLEKNSFKVEQYLSAPNLRCIERIHGKQGLVALDKLHNDPLLVVPAIFKCLKGKPQDITGKAYDYDKKWARVNAENDHKSLR